MVGVKRKGVSTGHSNVTMASKKQKTVPAKPTEAKLASPDAETAFDSDPIVESDTTEQSGEDDGASWPSGDEDEEDGGVALAEAEAEMPADGYTGNEKSCECYCRDNESTWLTCC